MPWVVMVTGMLPIAVHRAVSARAGTAPPSARESSRATGKTRAVARMDPPPWVPERAAAPVSEGSERQGSHASRMLMRPLDSTQSGYSLAAAPGRHAASMARIGACRPARQVLAFHQSCVTGGRPGMSEPDKMVPRSVWIAVIVAGAVQLLFGLLALGPGGKTWQVIGSGGVGLLGIVYGRRGLQGKVGLYR